MAGLVGVASVGVSANASVVLSVGAGDTPWFVSLRSMNLNEAQREAVNYIDGPLLVLAGAGSGKTGVITHKIAHLVGNLGIAPNRIAAITFTNKAAKEMQERIAKAIGSRAEGVIISTFHSLGVRILRQECRALKLKPGFSILDATDTTALFQELAGSVDKARLRMMQTRISLWKNSLLDSTVALRVAEGELEHAAAALYVDYERSLNAYQAVDFDDLIRLPVKLLLMTMLRLSVGERGCGICWSMNIRTPIAVNIV